MFRKIFRIIAFICLVFFFDQVIGFVLNKLYFAQKSGLLYRTTYSLDSTKAELLIFGASTANHHYVPEVFEKKLATEYYNTGRDGQGIFYFLGVEESIIKRYKPKIILLDINQSALARETSDYERLSSLLPYYASHPDLRYIMNFRSKYERIKNFSGIYPYNSTIITVIKGNLQKADNSIKGFIPSETRRNNMMLDSIPIGNNRALDDNKVTSLEKFITNCIRNDIRLFIIRSPYYGLFPAKDNSGNKIRQICQSNKIPYIDLSNFEILIKNQNIPPSSFFQDPGHLNTAGAKLFSEIVCDSISQYLNY